MTIAITRAVSPSFAQCELTHIERVPIDLEVAKFQHEAYEQALIRLGVSVVALPAEADLPDAVFVEDTAVVLDELAIMMRPGAASRRPEVAGIARALERYRPLAWITEPGTIDGGDVLRIGKTIYVGLSTRSDAAGIEGLRAIVAPLGYSVVGVPLTGCLHLKTAATAIADDVLLVNTQWLNPDVFVGLQFAHVHPDEPFAANTLRVKDALVYPKAFPRTLERIAKFVSRIELVDMSELAKAEGAVTCCSLIVDG